MDVTVWHCVCCSHPTSVPRPWSEYVHASVYVLFSAWLSMSTSLYKHTYMERWVLLCSTVCMFQSLYFWSHNLVTSVHASVHEFMSTLLIMCVPPPLENVHGNMGTPLWHYEFVTLTIFHYTSWLEGVHASVHVLLSTWLLMSASPHLHTYMERLVPLCGTGYVFQSSMSGPTPCLKCTHASVY